MCSQPGKCGILSFSPGTLWNEGTFCGEQMRKTLRALTYGLGLCVALALLSYVTTFHTGEGEWPQAALRIRAVDSAGSPVEGATFSVFHDNEEATGFKQSFCYATNWVSDKDGNIDLLVKPLRYTATSWLLFWHFQVNQPSVRLEATLDAPGYNSARIPLRTLLHTAEFKGSRPLMKRRRREDLPLTTHSTFFTPQ